MPARVPLRAAIVVVAAIALCPAATLRAEEPADVARRLYELVAAGDFVAVQSLLAGSADLARLRDTHRVRCVRLALFHVDGVQSSGDRAEVHATAGLAKLDPVDGRLDVDVDHPILAMTRDGGRWRIASWTYEEEKLVDAIVAAKSDDEAVALLMAHPELFDEGLTRTLRRIGTGFVNRQDLAKAARIAAVFRAFAGVTADDVVRANADGLAAMLAWRSAKRDFEEAVRLAQDALAAARRSGNPDAIGLSLYNLARAWEWHDGNTARGVPLLEEQFRLRARYIDESIAARAAILRCARFLERGDFRSCFPYVAVAREIALRTNDTLGLCAAEMVLANLFNDQNDIALALLHYRKARDLAAQAHFAGYAGQQRGVAHCALLLGREKEFRAAAEDVLKSSADVDHGTRAGTWGDIAADDLRLGDVAAADHAVQEALREANATPEDAVAQESSEMLARVRLAQRRWPEALGAARRAIAYATKNDSVSQLSPWVLAARAQLGLHDRRAAYASLREAVRYGEIERAVAGGSERQVALLFEPAAEAYSMLVDLLVEDGRVREALLVAEKAKARALLDILDRTRSNAEVDVPQSTLAEERSREKQLVAANTSGDRAAIEKARLELETFRSLVDANRPRLRASRGAGTLASIASLAPLLPDDRSAIVEYVAGEKRLHVFVIRRGVQVAVQSVPVGRVRLERLVERFTRALASHDVAYAADARRLYALLLAPVLRVAPRARDLAVIPDGALWRMPFEPLIDGQGAFAIETRTFFYAPSAAVLLREHARRAEAAAGEGLFLGFGDPRIEAPAGELAAHERGTRIAPIPEAAREVETIARMIGPRASAVFTGAEALESRAKAEAPRFRIVHLATHGVLDDANPMYSRLLLARRDGDGEDGVLEAREMLELGLRADLVVLSACDTARGGVHAGEGLLGMSWALFAAGAPSVIASQWRVGSARTETLMTSFYERWLKQPRQPFAKARALRAARLALLRDPEYRHPYYWSPFVLIGSAD
jgi:CHAT domain-containing protein